MKADIRTLKYAVNFPELVSETHDINRAGKVLCPVHNDHKPSCHIYKDGFKCFACGAYGDTVDWLKLIHSLSTAEAIKELERRAGGYVPETTPRRVVPHSREVTFKPIAEKVLEAHERQGMRLNSIPSSMAERGFTLENLRRLGFAAYGDDAVLPIPGPNGAVLALKRRYAEPRDGVRYRYTTKGCGTPAWCSPGFLEAEAVLVIEGELNGMACYLARAQPDPSESSALARPDLAVMGVAGTGGALHLEALKGRTVYVYADGDEPGQKAREKWATQALSIGACKVFVLEPWPMDACDLAGREGRAALRDLLTSSLESAQSFDAAKRLDASNTASRDLRAAQRKPYLMFSCSGFSSGPHLGARTTTPKGRQAPVLGGKPCL